MSWHFICRDRLLPFAMFAVPILFLMELLDPWQISQMRITSTSREPPFTPHEPAAAASCSFPCQQSQSRNPSPLLVCSFPCCCWIVIIDAVVAVGGSGSWMLPPVAALKPWDP